LLQRAAELAAEEAERRKKEAAYLEGGKKVRNPRTMRCYAQLKQARHAMQAWADAVHQSLAMHNVSNCNQDPLRMRCTMQTMQQQRICSMIVAGFSHHGLRQLHV
jgi:hypothetical protein